VDTSARFTSLAVDSQGNVHVSYAGGDSYVLKYAFRSNASGRWFTSEIDRNQQEFSTHLILDTQGNPLICYTPRTMLKYARFNGQRWLIQEIAPGGTKEYTCSLAIAPDGTPFISWYQTRSNDGSNYYHLRSATLQNGAWLARTVDFDGEAGKWSSLVVDAKGIPSISYSLFPSGQLKLAQWNGKEWETSFIDVLSVDLEKGVRGMGNSMCIDPQGKLHVSYYEEHELRYAEQQGDRWFIQKVDQIAWLGGWVGYWSSLALDHQGHPHVSYDDGGALKHAYWDGTRWHLQLVAMRGQDAYRYSSLGIAADDTIYVSYRDPEDGSLKVAVGHPTAKN